MVTTTTTTVRRTIPTMEVATTQDVPSWPLNRWIKLLQATIDLSAYVVSRAGAGFW